MRAIWDEFILFKPVSIGVTETTPVQYKHDFIWTNYQYQKGQTKWCKPEIMDPLKHV